MNLKYLKLTTLVFALAMSPAALFAGGLDQTVGDTVKRLSLYLKSKNEHSISIGHFNGPPQVASTSGPGIVKLFHDHFATHQIEIKTKTNIGLKGEYTLTKTPTGGVGVKIIGSLVDPFGDVLIDFNLNGDEAYHEPGQPKPGDPGYVQPPPVKPGYIEKIVDEPHDVVEILGATTHLYPEDSDEYRQQDLKEQILHPKPYIGNGHQCAAANDSPYLVEVLVHGQPLKVNIKDGLAFCDIHRGDIYEIKLINNSQYEAAVKLAIDGLNVFTFSNIKDAHGRARYSVYIIPPRSHIIVKGWHRDNTYVSSFLVTKYADSAAASINHTQNIGTISAVFSAAWLKNGPPPHDENLRGKGDGNATGFGPDVQQVTKEVEREIGKLRSSVSIRYTK